MKNRRSSISPKQPDLVQSSKVSPLKVLLASTSSSQIVGAVLQGDRERKNRSSQLIIPQGEKKTTSCYPWDDNRFSFRAFPLWHNLSSRILPSKLDKGVLRWMALDLDIISPFNSSWWSFAFAWFLFSSLLSKILGWLGRSIPVRTPLHPINQLQV